LEIPPPFVMRNPSLLRALARTFLAGEPVAAQIARRASRLLGREWRWLRPLAERYVIAVEGKTRPRHRDVVQFFLNDAGFGRAWAKYFAELSVAEWLTDAQRMQPVTAAEGWDLPRIESAGTLCDWFWLDPRQLEWFADLKGLGCGGKLHHYHYRSLAKRDRGPRQSGFCSARSGSAWWPT
jgi:hypothetical protein